MTRMVPHSLNNRVAVIPALALLHIFCYLLFFTSYVHSANSPNNAEDYRFTTSNGTDLDIVRYSAEGDYLVIIVAPGYGGVPARILQLAQRLAQTGIEVWRVDLSESLFVPHSTDQMRAFTGHYIAELMSHAIELTRKKIILSARSYGAIPVLRGIDVWLDDEGRDSSLIGAMLFSPDLYATIPPLGVEPDYLPIVSVTRVPIFIYQDGNRGNRWYVNKLVETLSAGGSQTLLKILPGVTGLFFEEDIAAETLTSLETLPEDIKTNIRLLEKFPIASKPVLPKEAFIPVGSGIDIQLKKFKGNFPPIPIKLGDAMGNSYSRENYKGQITIVNFWATWCPPCVEEIPSLNNLRKKMKDLPFELISINYAESAQTILDFLGKVDVDYPVLLDETGEFSAKWKVVAYPSTFIIAPDGVIHYGVNAAIHWDNEEVVHTLRRLYEETTGHK